MNARPLTHTQPMMQYFHHTCAFQQFPVCGNGFHKFLSPQGLGISQTILNKSTLSQRTDETEDVTEPEFKVFYRLPFIVGLRILSRVKIAQTCLTLAILPPLYHYHAVGMVSTWQLQFSTGAATFALVMLYAMSFFMRRIIGAMYMHRDGNLIKVSHLTFWGNRCDFTLPIVDVVPLIEGSNKAGEVMKKLERYSTKDVLYFTLRFGRIRNLEAFEDVFGRI